MKKIKRLMQVVFTSSFLFATSSSAVAEKKLAEIPKQFQGQWNNGKSCDFDGPCSHIILGKNWISRESAGGGSDGEVVQIEELGKDHIRILAQLSYGAEGQIHTRSKDWIGLKIANGKLKLSKYADGWHTKTSNKVGKYQSGTEDIWQIPVSLNKVLFIQRLVTSISGTYDGDGNLKTRRVISKNDRYFIKTVNGIKQIRINDRGDKRYVEIPDDEYEQYKNVFTFTKKGNQWHLDKQEQKEN